MSGERPERAVFRGTEEEKARIDEQYVVAKEALRVELTKYLERIFNLPSYVNRRDFMDFMLEKYLEYAEDAIECDPHGLQKYDDSAKFVLPQILPALLEPNWGISLDEFCRRVDDCREYVEIPDKLAAVSDRMVELLKSSEYLRYRASGHELRDEQERERDLEMARQREFWRQNFAANGGWSR